MATEPSMTAQAPWQEISETLIELKHGCAGVEQLLDSTFGELEQLREEVARKARELEEEHTRIQQEREQLQEDRAALTEEMKQFCMAIKDHLPELSGAASTAAASGGGDPVIDSVMAQFSKLQKQIAQRRQPRQGR